MDTDTWKIENNICRCCHAEGYFFNLAEPRPFCGETEVYSDMIRDIFDIDMKPIPGALSELTYSICMSCIFKLREAILFKKQVQRCEDKFLDYYYTNKLEAVKKTDAAKAVIKIEPVIEFKEEYLNEDELDSNDDTNIDFEMEDNDEDEPKSDVELAFLSKKGKGKGKGKPEEAPKPQSAAAVKAESRATNKKLVKVERIKVPVKKKDGKRPKFRLRADDYEISGDMLKCARCNKEYDKKGTLHQHIKYKHYSVSKYTCDICKEGFSTETRFIVHKYETHKIDERSNCNACKAVFNTKRQLIRHKNNFHMLGEKYKCDYCEYESYSFEGLYKHKFKHKTVKNFHCKFCRKSFLRKTTMALHERIHTGDKRKICKECGKAFVQKASLNYHMARHHPEVKF